MQRPLYTFLAVLSLASAIFMSGAGCGGGGGSSSGGTNGNPVDPTIAVRQVTATATTGVASRDLRNTVVGDVLKLHVLTVDRSGAAVLADLTDARSDAPDTVATITADGILTAVGPSNRTYTVRGTVGGDSVSAVLRVSSVAERTSVTGLVRTPEGVGVAGATVTFYATGSSEPVATAYTGNDGLYQANVSNGATRFLVDARALKASLPSASVPTYLYYNVFKYVTDGEGYDASLGCTAPLPSLSAPVTLGDVVFKRHNAGSSPPDPPSGCR